VDELVSFNTTPVPTRKLATYFQPITTQGYGIGPVIFFQLNPNRPNSYTQQWNVALQKNIHELVTVEGAYVGSEAVKLPMSYPLNVPLPGPGVIQTRRQNPFFASGSLIVNDGTASYNALQAKAEIRSWHRLNLLGAYTVAKGLDGQSADYQGSQFRIPTIFAASAAAPISTAIKSLRPARSIGFRHYAANRSSYALCSVTGALPTSLPHRPDKPSIPPLVPTRRTRAPAADRIASVGEP
jgi:hypothetical protein